MTFTYESDYLPYIAHLKAEHRKIDDVVKRIQAWLLLESPPAPEHSECDRLEILKRQLGSLRNLLKGHFEEEEAGGCVEEAISRNPSLSSAAGELESEHRGLLAQLDRMIENVTRAGFATGTAAAFEDAFNMFAKELYDHETRENRILEQGFNVTPDNGGRNDQPGLPLAN